MARLKSHERHAVIDEIVVRSWTLPHALAKTVRRLTRLNQKTLLRWRDHWRRRDAEANGQA